MSRRWKRWRRSRPCSKRLSRVYASKGPVVEEWADRRFFRPVGWWLAKTLAPTGISADDVTLASLVLGVAAGHFFFYSRPWLNAIGVALFVVSDVLDSADGQLARLRGTSTRMGRILDGLADTGRFVSLYAHLGARLYVAGWGWSGPLLALAAILSHSYQAAAADYIRQAYLYFAVGKGSELDLPEQTPPRFLQAHRSGPACQPGFTAITYAGRRGSSRVRPRWRARSPAAPCRCRYSRRGRSGSARLLRAARGSHKTSASSYSPSPLYRGGRPRIAGS